ncbi:MAG TPA: META domain-containing protein, partial [Roseiflexaceae bacterium]|nr:META domain-containing protein [Roseiflexaceae bacterium]
MRTSIQALCAALVLALLIGGSVATTPAAQAQSAERCFTETNQCISGRIREYWEQNGGLPVFGYPISPQLTEEGVTVQYFERQRFELHPEIAAPYDVLLGRLGAEILASNGITWQDLPAASDPLEGCRYFAETRHNVCDQEQGRGFLTAWRSNGLRLDNRRAVSDAESLALFGFPISDVYDATVDGKPVKIQWFERARFEWHPDNPAAYRVLFGRLGAESKGEPVSAPLPTSEARNATPLLGTNWQLTSFGAVKQQQPAVAGAPSTLMFDENNRVTGNTGCNGFGGAYTATANGIAFSQVVSTLRACDEPVNTQEREVLAALQGTVRYEIAGGTLTIYYNGDQSALTYQARTQATLQDTNWQLASYGAGNQQQPAANAAATALMFAADNRVSGVTGCNSFSGSYSVANDQIAFGELAVTRKACPPPLDTQEREVLAGLRGTARYAISGDTLTIYYNGDQSTLVYKASTPASTNATVTGVVTYRERIALPSGAVITVRLQDTSRQDAAAPAIAEQTITTNGEQVPIAFTLTYNTSQIKPENTYAVRAEVRIDGKLAWTSSDAYLVITQGNPTNI